MANGVDEIYALLEEVKRLREANQAYKLAVLALFVALLVAIITILVLLSLC